MESSNPFVDVIQLVDCRISDVLFSDKIMSHDYFTKLLTDMVSALKKYFLECHIQALNTTFQKRKGKLWIFQYTERSSCTFKLDFDQFQMEKQCNKS